MTTSVDNPRPVPKSGDPPAGKAMPASERTIDLKAPSHNGESLSDRIEEWGKTPEIAARLIWEEIRFRQQQGEAISVDEVLDRFPQWRDELRQLQRSFAVEDRFSFPTVGEQVAGYDLIGSLGRGVQGQVFLARQLELGGRPVVLKCTPCVGIEHLKLARLQHTYIVPLFSVDEVPERNLRLMAMPFLGAISLSDLLCELDGPPARRTGADVSRILARVQQAFAKDLPAPTDADALSKLSYATYICQVGCCLAEALDYAHKHGWVHLDIKPSNILLAPDGRPLLLDFHLARRPLHGGETRLDEFGGTWRFMSPEQCAAVAAASMSQPIPGPVDQRSDIYALALVLFEALGGERNARDQPEMRTLRQRNPHVSVGLADIIARCLAPDPDDRYANAGLLAEDLRRHLDNRPLRGVRNRSWRESWRKWRRRRPLALAVYGMIATLGLAVSIPTLLVCAEYQDRISVADAAFKEGQHLLRKDRFGEAEQAFRRGQQRLKGMPFELSLRHALLDHENLAVALKDAQELHTTVNSLRLQLVIDPLPRRSLMVLQMAAGNLWTKRSRFQHYTELPRFEPAVRERIGADLLELALLRAEVHVRLVPPVNQPQAAQEALQMLKEAQTLLGPHPALLMEQRRSADALELLLLRDEMDIVLKAHPPRTAWEYAFVGRAHLRRGDYEAAEKALRHAHQMQPLHFLPNFYLGVCAHRRSKYTESIGAFSFCLGQEPHAEIFYLRGLGLAALGLDADARVDFNQAITRDAYLGPAYFQRGLLHAKSGHHADARADFERSLSHGGARIPTKCEIARTLLAEKNWQAARDCLDRVLEEEPACAVARTLLKGIP